MKIKKNLMIFVLLVNIKVFSCSCGKSPAFVKNFIGSEFVAEITIGETQLNMIDNEICAKFKINKLYKGESYENLYFSNPDPNISGCDVFLSKGMNLVVYLDSYEGKLVAGGCDRIIKDGIFVKKEIEILNKIIQSNYLYNNKIHSKDEIHEINIDIPKKKFSPINMRGIFQIELNKQNKVIGISTIFGYNSFLDERLIKELKQIKWIRDLKSVKSSKHLIEINYWYLRRKRHFFKNKFFIASN